MLKILILALTVPFGVSASAQAPAFPASIVRIIAPTAPGSGMDTTMRIFGPLLSCSNSECRSSSRTGPARTGRSRYDLFIDRQMVTR